MSPRTPRPGTPHFEDSQVEITRLVVGPMDNNVYVARCRETGESVLIDAANEHEKLLELCRRLDVRQVLQTHGHWDHIQAVAALRAAGHRVGVMEEDSAMLPAHDLLLAHDTEVSVGRLRLRTIHTPGHTPGSTCFGIEGSPVLFSGDTLFPGGPGATRWHYSSFPKIIQSIERLFEILPPETIVMPGHGVDTTIGTESPHIEEWAKRGW